MSFKKSLIPLAVLAMSQQLALAQDAAKLDRVEVTGSLIKRTDKETPAVVQTITAEQIRKSGFGTVEELLRANSAMDSAGSIQDGAASGFVNGLATISMRGMGAQGTLVLINGRRMAPAANVDVNFGRGTLLNINTIPKGAIERIEILKDGASALYGSDAMAGVVNYILKKEYEGLEASAGYGSTDAGVGQTANASLSYGFGNLEEKGFNVFGGLELSKRDQVMHSELKDKGLYDHYNVYRNLNGETTRFTPDSVASRWANYYRVPPSLAGSTPLDGRSVANNDVNGANFLGSMPGCPAELTVGQGVPNRPAGFTNAQASLRNGMCRYVLDNKAEAISEQERIGGTLRANLKLSSRWTGYADLMLGRTKSTAQAAERAMTTTLASQQVPNVVITPKLDGTLAQQGGIILPVNHPDNPTRNSANPEPVQLIYRFHDLPALDITEQTATRLALGLEGSLGEWDLDTALLYSRMDNQRTQTNRLRASLLNASIASGTYRFNGEVNNAAALASVASDAINEGDSSILSLDVRAGRELFALAGGQASLAVGAEARREEFNSNADDNYRAGDYIGLVANLASGKRDAYAAFGELSLPVAKTLELQTALRFENYSDFGSSTTGKLGFKWSVLPQLLIMRGTASTGFRAPAISQIGNASTVSFNNNQEKRYFDPLRCDSSNAANPISRADPPDLRDCNLLNFTQGVPVANRPGNLPTLISANPDLKPETSKSASMGFVFSPTRNFDLGLSYWYVERNKEIRLQRSQDILDAYLANPANSSQVVRNPNPATWLPGQANSGPILAVIRKYDNYNWTKTTGLDFDLNAKFPTQEIGRFTFSLFGTLTKRFQEQILSGTTPRDLLGSSTAEVPKIKANVRLGWDIGDWSSWVRHNHTSQLTRIGTTAPCLTSSTAAGVYRRENGSCYVGAERSWDMGVSFSGFKGWVLAANVLNLTDDYGRSIDIPSSFNYWDSGTASQVGRRYNVSVSYKMD